jgi:SPP1 family predicted phage head-tail adaptor
VSRIKAGKLRHLANVEVFTKSGAGDRGQPIGRWVPLLVNVPCEIRALSGAEAETARQLVAKATHKVSMRYHSGVAPTMRIVWQGRTMGIGWADEGDFKRNTLELLVVEQQTGAT